MRRLQVSERVRWAGLVVACCVIVAVIATWPLVFQLGAALPIGTEHELTVPLASLWALWWNVDRLQHGFSNYWDAPIFYPNQAVFTYSEPQPLTALAGLPLWLLGLSPLIIYNLTVLAMLTLNGVFGYRVARALRMEPAPALLVGIMLVSLPFGANILGVLPLIPIFGILWSLEGIIRFSATGSTRMAIWAALGVIVTFTTSQQYLLMAALFIAAALGLALFHQGVNRLKLRKKDQRTLRRLGLPMLGAAVVILLFALPSQQEHARSGFVRTERIVQALSARPQDFFTRPETSSLPIPGPALTDTGGLFPGVLLFGLALASLRRIPQEPFERRWTWFWAATAGGAALLALGLNLGVQGLGPFAVLRALVPGFATLRSPFRFAMLAQLALPILAGLTLARGLRDPRRWYRYGMVGLALLAAAENLAVPSPVLAVPPPPAWTTWASQQPATSVIAHVPFAESVEVKDYERDGFRMLWQVEHEQPIVNGYSSFFPQAIAPDGSTVPVYLQFQLAMVKEFPKQELLCILGNSLRVKLLVIDQDWLAAHPAALEPFKTMLQSSYRDDQVEIFRLALPADACQRPPE